MRIIYLRILLLLVVLGCTDKKALQLIKNPYLPVVERKESKPHSTYYIDPNQGEDTNSGTSKDMPWKSFKPVNQLLLTEGNTIEILSAGDFKTSLVLSGKGTKEAPITVKFASGVYNFYPELAYKAAFNISNTNDAPEGLKAVAFYFLEAEHVAFKGMGAEIVFRGKVMETCIRNSKAIRIENISFDYKHPTVSEFEIATVKDHVAEAKIHPDSKFDIVDSMLVWKGEGWEHKAYRLFQVFDGKNQRVARKTLPLDKLRFSKIGSDKIAIHFDKNPGLKEGLIYQNRDTFRDYAAIFTEGSEGVVWKDVDVNFMHGMGFVSQFSENITFDGLRVAPKEGSGRTCAAWADILHFSGCKGEILVKNSFLSAANDDAINVHGTHLRIVEALADNKIKVRFMHPQTYGFKAFNNGDEIEFIRATSLLPYSKAKVVEAKLLNATDMELTLQSSLPANIEPNDVVENVTWTPDVTIVDNTITHIPTRGILVTTRGKVRIENNAFLKTQMSAILIADDANSWFESGYVRDVMVKNNKFVDCGSPVINIHPENAEVVKGNFVHKNIIITDNQFQITTGILVGAKSTDGIMFANNSINIARDVTVKDLLYFSECDGTTVKNNTITKQ
ncbi:right-handed parallel beta-helix repeat-containing protein [Snuella sedimenti]|uniref:Right-handed parallel beta-helix repeat-containing protein n=1 Tax=Snuella sedimenti TaxID=2798802 RepID=A0A8J7LXU6_9FLAO|nr:right-handed parallel beta-helix repeat-containing protein [Snuella sedimenti]MBJ6367361.1 right-handed parallel beta-helix repeat-containing protein [Snuella sedimenti]